MMDIKRDQMFPIPFPILWNVFITSNLLAAKDEMSFFLYKATLKCAKSDQFCRPFQAAIDFFPPHFCFIEKVGARNGIEKGCVFIVNLNI